MVSTLADFHYAPTKSAAKNLLKQGIEKEKVYVTGNTVIDALLHMVDSNHTFDFDIEFSPQITPLFKAFTESKQASPAQQFTELTEAFTKSQVGLIKKISDMAGQSLNQDPEVITGTVTEEPNIMEKALAQGIQLISDWGSHFMRTKGQDREKAVNTIKTDPRFSKLMDNKKLIDELYKKGCANKKIGVKVMNEIFESLGCDLQEETEAAPA